MSTSRFDRENALRLTWALEGVLERSGLERGSRITCERSHDLSLGLVGHDGETPHRRGCAEGMRAIDFGVAYAVALKRAVAPGGVGNRDRSGKHAVWNIVEDEAARLREIALAAG